MMDGQVLSSKPHPSPIEKGTYPRKPMIFGKD